MKNCTTNLIMLWTSMKKHLDIVLKWKCAILIVIRQAIGRPNFLYKFTDPSTLLYKYEHIKKQPKQTISVVKNNFVISIKGFMEKKKRKVYLHFFFLKWLNVFAKTFLTFPIQIK